MSLYEFKSEYFLLLGMSSYFFNFLFKSTQSHQMKIVNDSISEWPHLMLQH